MLFLLLLFLNNNKYHKKTLSRCLTIYCLFDEQEIFKFFLNSIIIIKYLDKLCHIFTSFLSPSIYLNIISKFIELYNQI